MHRSTQPITLVIILIPGPTGILSIRVLAVFVSQQQAGVSFTDLQKSDVMIS